MSMGHTFSFYLFLTYSSAIIAATCRLKQSHCKPASTWLILISLYGGKLVIISELKTSVYGLW